MALMLIKTTVTGDRILAPTVAVVFFQFDYRGSLTLGVTPTFKKGIMGNTIAKMPRRDGIGETILPR